MNVKGIAINLVNQLRPVVKTAAKVVKKNPLLFGAGALGLYVGYKVADSFKKQESNVEDTELPKIEPKGIISTKKPVTVLDLIEQYIKNKNKTKLERLRDFWVIFVPHPINPAQNPSVNQDKYRDFIKEILEIQQKNRNHILELESHKIPENLTKEERIALITENGGPGLIC